MYDVLVCDVDEKAYEGLALGLLYTTVSRGTTLGNDDGSDSAVYFKGTTFKPDRIRNLTRKAGSTEEFKKAIERRHWVNHIESKCRSSLPRVKQIIARQDELCQWATSKTYSYDELYNRIEKYKQR
jgi:hypothetical protein